MEPRAFTITGLKVNLHVILSKPLPGLSKMHPLCSQQYLPLLVHSLPVPGTRDSSPGHSAPGNSSLAHHFLSLFPPPFPISTCQKPRLTSPVHVIPCLWSICDHTTNMIFLSAEKLWYFVSPASDTAGYVWISSPWLHCQGLDLITFAFSIASNALP